MDDRAAALHFLKNCQYMTIAVISDGLPWAVPVHIQSQAGFVFEWDSLIDTVHSLAIARQPTVALSMYRHADDAMDEFGFYALAEASKIADLTDGRAKYRAVVTKAWVNDEKHQKRQIAI